MSTKVIKATSKGQVTIPMKWRKQVKTDDFILEIQHDQLVLKPLYLNKEEIIFDADRDNNGKGITAAEMLQMLNEIDNG